jgi:1-acyl-sn-glycerol-3-phosphate acyltransferase
MDDGPQAKALAVAESRSGRAFYGLARRLIRGVLYRYFRLVHRGQDHLNVTGPLILAPVHRSNLDAPMIAALSDRRTKSLAKRSLFESAPVGWMMSALGGFPVERGTADRDALRAAQELLEAGEAMIVFPEGTRQTGSAVADVFDGAAFLASRTGARVVPIGIAGTEGAMPPGARFPRRSRVAIVVGEPLDPPVAAGTRVTLSQRRAFTDELRERLQFVFDEAQIETEQP